MQALEARLVQMENSFNTNTKVFSDGVQMLELQQEVLRRAIQGIYSGGIRHEVPITHAIDWGAYLREFIDELAAHEAKKESDSDKGVILLDSSDVDEPIIFGGSR